MIDSGVYVIVSPSGRVYIGSTKNFRVRQRDHFYKLRKGVHPNQALQRAWTKYDGDFRFIVIERCDVSVMIAREQFWIDYHAVIWSRMYNASAIAGRPEHNDEARKKMSAAARGRVVSDETRQRLSDAGKGRKHSAETIAKIKAHGVIGAPMDRDKALALIAMTKGVPKRRKAATGQALVNLREGARRAREAKGRIK